MVFLHPILNKNNAIKLKNCMRKKCLLVAAFALALSAPTYAQRFQDKLDRSLVAVQTTSGVFCSWRVLGEEYYNVEYNLYRDGVKLNDAPLKTSNYTDASGSASSKYTVRAVVKGVEQGASKEVTAIDGAGSFGYIEISKPKRVLPDGTDVTDNFEPNDATVADVDGDGEMELIVKQWSLDNNSGYQGPNYDRIEIFKLDGTLLWWIDCGANLWDFQHNETNIAAYDWDEDGKAECIMRAADGTTIHAADGTIYVIGDPSKKYRASGEQFVHEGTEFLIYLNGQTGVPYNIGPSEHPTYVEYPLKRLEAGETDLDKAWGDGYGHRSSKHFFGAPYFDGRNPSIFLARGIYSRHKMMALDVDKNTHKLSTRWNWICNTPGSPWYGQGYHNYAIADVDQDGRDEIVFGSMVIDDNGKGLSTTGLGHGDAEHVGDYNPYVHGLEIYACNEDKPSNNYRDATTSKIYYRLTGGSDDGRSMMGNFTNKYPGAIGNSGHDTPISSVTNSHIDGLTKSLGLNFRIYWDGDLLDEGLNYSNGTNTAFQISHYDSGNAWLLTGSLSNNDTKGTPCFQGDILGDWREEVVARTADGKIRIYTSTIPTEYRISTLLSDKQYRNAMVWQMNGYNQPPAVSYFLGELEGITVAPPAETNIGREEVSNGGSIGSSLDDKQVLMAETNDMTVSVANGASPELFIDNAPTWVQGHDDNDNITTTVYTHTLTGGAFTGATRVVKQGDGILVLPNVKQTYSGNTDIWAGTVCFDGTMANSPVWLNRLTTLNSNGGNFAKGISAEYGAAVNVGGKDKKGTLTTTTLNLGFGSILGFKIYSDLSSDVLAADKLVLEKKTWPNGNGPEYDVPRFKFTTEGGSVVAGTYTIAKVAALEGDIAAVKIEGLTGHKASLSYENGEIKLTIADVRAASDVEWTGASDSSWDIADKQNFKNGDNANDVFVTGDRVWFNDNAANTTVNISTPVSPASVTFDNNAKDYTLGGEAITGSSSITKEGSAALNINNVSDFVGTVNLNGGTTTVASLGQSSGVNNGAFGVYTNAVTINGGTLVPAASITTDHPIAVGGNGAVIDVPQNVTLKLGTSVSGGNNTLTKSGAGQLTLPASVSLSQLILNGGTVQGSEDGSSQHAYPETIVLNGGTLRDPDGMGSYSTNRANVKVSEGATASWYLDSRCNYRGSLSGSGTLTMYAQNVRGNWYGSTSNFTGTLNIASNKTGSYDPQFLFSNNANLSKATVNITVACSNEGNTIQLGNLKGNATLSGSGTWKIGALGDDVPFNGIISGGKIIKVGDGVWTMAKQMPDVSGNTQVDGGVLNLTNTSTSSLYFKNYDVVAANGGTIAGLGYVHAINVNDGGTICPGNYTQTVKSGSLKTQSGVYCYSGSTVKLFVRHNNNANFRGTKLVVGATLRINGDIVVDGYNNMSGVKAGEEFVLWEASAFDGTPTSIVLPELPEELAWDTSDLLKAKGILRVVDAATGIKDISADARFSGTVYSLDGKKIADITTTKATLEKDIKHVSGQAGVYVVRVNGESVKVAVK